MEILGIPLVVIGIVLLIVGIPLQVIEAARKSLKFYNDNDDGESFHIKLNQAVHYKYDRKANIQHQKTLPDRWIGGLSVRFLARIRPGQV